MDFNDALWSFILTMSCIALLVEGASIFRILFITRQTLRHYLLLLLPITVSIWSFAVLWHALNVFEAFPTYISIHLTYAFWLMLRAGINQAIIACQVQAGITLAVFIAMIVIERKMLPHVEHVPAWVLAKQQTIRGNRDM